MGRWLSRDPIGEDGGLNVYLACDNDLISDYDRIGLAKAGEKKKNEIEVKNADEQRKVKKAAEKAAKTCSAAGGLVTEGKCCCQGQKFNPSTDYCCEDGVKSNNSKQAAGQFCRVKMTGAQLPGLGAFSHCYLSMSGIGDVGWWPKNGVAGSGNAVTGHFNTQWNSQKRCKDIIPDSSSKNRCKCTSACLLDEMSKPGLYTLAGPGDNCCERAQRAMKNCGCKLI